MDGRQLRSDIRKELRARRLGSDCICVLCGKPNPEVLRRISRSLLEEHHLAGAASDKTLTVTVCRNCHAELTEAQRDAAIDLLRRSDRSLLEALEAVLRGTALFFAQLAERLVLWADDLAGLVRALDDACPAWRSLPETQQ